jgi:hypothetical protein
LAPYHVKTGTNFICRSGWLISDAIKEVGMVGHEGVKILQRSLEYGDAFGLI